MIDKKKYFVRMAVLTDVLAEAESEEQAIDIAKNRVCGALCMSSVDADPSEVEILDVILEDELNKKIVSTS